MSSALHTSTTVNDERYIEKAISPDRNSAIVMGCSMAGCSRPVRICATYAQKEQATAGRGTRQLHKYMDHMLRREPAV